ncbi:MAG: peptidoglycan DD-metalloendopeptidase family protein [Ignavibacteriales bacterium]
MILIPLLFLFQMTILAQGQGKINDKKSELRQIRSEIDKLEGELIQKAKKEKKSIEILENYNRQNHLLNKLINSIRTEEKKKDEQISTTELQIAVIQKEIDRLKTTYEKYIVHLYKHGKESELNNVFSSGSFNQALIRYKYLKKISFQRGKNIAELKEKQNEISLLKGALEQERDEKREIAEQKEKEEKALENKLTERKSILNVLKNDKASLKKELELKRVAEGEIRNLISRLIDAEQKKALERKRKEERLRAEEKLKAEEKLRSTAKHNNERKTEKQITQTEDTKEVPYVNHSLPEADSYSGLESFASRKGSLHWPVENGRIIRRFGENKNTKLNTVTLNYGIDIKASADVSVRAVSEGIVSAVNWVPGYGSVLIITHKNNYRTVYGHLGEIFVNEGAKVNAGAPVGKIGESLEGNILHFEIWNERINQNPEVWLSRK